MDANRRTKNTDSEQRSEDGDLESTVGFKRAQHVTLLWRKDSRKVVRKEADVSPAGSNLKRGFKNASNLLSNSFFLRGNRIC